jgi:hypothetical protein
MYSNIDIPYEANVDNLESRKRFHCFTQILKASISDVGPPRKKIEIE